MIGLTAMMLCSVIHMLSDVNKKYKWYHNLEITVRSLMFPFYYTLMFWCSISVILSIHYMYSIEIELSALAWNMMGLFAIIIIMGIFVLGVFSYFRYQRRIEEIKKLSK